MNWSKSSFGSSRTSAPPPAPKPTASAHGSSSVAQSSFGSAKTAPTYFGSITVATSSYGNVELVELPGSVGGKSYLIVIAGVVAGLALLVPGGILLYGAYLGSAAATGGIIATATALAVAYPVTSAIGVGACTGAGFQALMYAIPGGDNWEELGTQILLGSVLGGVTGGAAAGAALAVSAGYTIAAQSVQGALTFGVSEVTLQALIDASIVAAAAGAANAVATHVTRWVIDGDMDVVQLFVDIGLNTILSVAPIVGGGVALRFCTSRAAAMVAAGAIGVSASFLEPPETAGMAVLRASMGGLQSSLLGIHLHKITQLFHVTNATTVQYQPANAGLDNHGFNIYEPVIHGHVRTNHQLRTATPTFGAEIHVKLPDVDGFPYRPAPLALQQATAMQARPKFVAAANTIRDAIVANGAAFANPANGPAAPQFPPNNTPHRPMLQKEGIAHPQLRPELQAVHRACAGGAADVMRAELRQVLPHIGHKRQLPRDD